jgi:hypothetical protein
MPTHLRRKLFHSPVPPTANTSTAFEALTWTEVGAVEQLPVFGNTHANIESGSVTDGTMYNDKGMKSFRSSEIICLTPEEADAGQTALVASANSWPGRCALKMGIDLGSGTNYALAAGDAIVYAHGYVHSHVRNQGTGSSYQGFTVTFQQNADEVEATEPV